MLLVAPTGPRGARARQRPSAPTAGSVLWSVAGVKVPVKFRVASLLLTPSIEQRDGRDALALRARIEKLDVKVLPDFVDDTVLHRINDALAKADEVLVWRFSKMFDRQLSLPKRSSPRARSRCARGGVRFESPRARSCSRCLSTCARCRARRSTRRSDRVGPIDRRDLRFRGEHVARAAIADERHQRGKCDRANTAGTPITPQWHEAVIA